VVANSGMSDLLWAFIAILVALAVVLGVVYGLKHAFSYRIKDSKLSIVMLGLTVQRVGFSDIERVEVVPFAALLPFSGSFRCDVFLSWKWCGYRKRLVLITRRAGLVKRIIISPEEPERFTTLLKVASPEAAGRESARRPASANGPK